MTCQPEWPSKVGNRPSYKVRPLDCSNCSLSWLRSLIKEAFHLAEQIADSLPAGLVALRTVVDACFCHRNLQVGQIVKLLLQKCKLQWGSQVLFSILGGWNTQNYCVNQYWRWSTNIFCTWLRACQWCI